MKKNNKGFVLVETLVVTVFVAAIFSVIYLNFYPLAGEYERRTFYDDIDSKYGAYWVKFFIQRDSYPNISYSFLGTNCYTDFSCNNLTNSNDREVCNEMMDRLNIERAIITYYQLSGNNVDKGDGDTDSKHAGLKSMADSVFSDDPALASYIHYLPNYEVKSLNGARFRVIVKFKRSGDSLEDEEFYTTFGTMEVIKGAS